LLHPEICDHSELGSSNASWSAQDLAEARKWFNAHVEVFVLNLPRDVQRLQQVQERLHQLQIDFTRVEGVDFSQSSTLQSAQREGLIPASYNLTAAQAAANDPSNRMGGIKGTAGCAAAHFRAQARAIRKLPSEYYNTGPVKFDGSSVPKILIPSKSRQCSVGVMHFSAELDAEGDGLRWLVSYGDSWNRGFSIGVDANGQLLCLAMGHRLEGGSVPNGKVVTVTAEWDGSTFRCGVHGAEIGRLELPGGIPCQKQASIGGWFSGYMSHIQFGIGPKAHQQKPLAMVLEDDVHPSDDFVERLWHLVSAELPCDWAALSLRSMCSFGTCVSRHIVRVQPDINEPEERCRHGVNYGFQGVLYRLGALPRLRERWREVVFDPTRPHCLDVDVALASISDEVGYYAVPFVQFPGFLQEFDTDSSRMYINDH
jgi:GR25 family glycosyltransferase involved in LPS biosynthesis